MYCVWLFCGILWLMKRTFVFTDDDEAQIKLLAAKLKAETGEENFISVLRWAVRIAVKVKARAKSNG